MKKGISPQKLALCGALGITLGVFPFYGITVFLCVIAAFIFRLNQAAIQVVNFAVYPLWFIFLVPFYKMGEYIFDAAPIPFTDPKELIETIQTDGFYFIQSLGTTIFHAAVAWLLISIPAAVILYFSLLSILKKRIKTDTNE